MLLIWLKLNIALGNEWEFLAGNFPGDVSVRYNAGLYSLSKHRYKDAETHLRAAEKCPDRASSQEIAQ